MQTKPVQIYRITARDALPPFGLIVDGDDDDSSDSDSDAGGTGVGAGADALRVTGRNPSAAIAAAALSSFTVASSLEGDEVRL